LTYRSDPKFQAEVYLGLSPHRRTDLICGLRAYRECKIDLFLHQQGLDTTTSGGRMMFGMLSVFAEFEKAMIRERVLAGMKRAKEKGTRSAKPLADRPSLKSGELQYGKPIWLLGARDCEAWQNSLVWVLKR
jgi:hypothetical protein